MNLQDLLVFGIALLAACYLVWHWRGSKRGGSCGGCQGGCGPKKSEPQLVQISVNTKRPGVGL